METKYIGFNEFLVDMAKGLSPLDYSAIKRVAEIGDVDKLNDTINNYFGFKISDLKTENIPILIETLDSDFNSFKPMSTYVGGYNSKNEYYSKYIKYKKKYLRLKKQN